jgi:uncharacterized SAM-binding protein YcdF (DUF218 family)
MMMFLFKKVVGALFLPFTVCFLLLAIGMILLWVRTKKLAGIIVISLGVIFLGFMSYGWVPNWLLRPLEYKYPPLIKVDKLPKVKWIVVLGGGHRSDPRIPPSSQPSSASLCRLVEGIRLHHALPGTKLILSGGAILDPVSEAETMANMALAIGVSQENLSLETKSKDTEDQSEFIQKIVAKDPFILVTSAAHMPRSMGLFKRRGMNPIAAPTDFKIKERTQKGISPGDFYPSLEEMDKAQTAIYEYLGMSWAKLRGRI